ncbi:MAG TPA: hypothetical protein GX745_03960 [Clostridiales bacterium]|nr:hypothetical protein [Clostridiales bacterium]
MIFDNTKATKEFANSKQAKAIIDNIPKGNEARKYNIGDIVNCNGIDKARINDCYIDNGYFIYSIVWTIKGKKYNKDIRQCDILEVI